MTFAFRDFSVTTWWVTHAGTQIWLANDGEHRAKFLADRTAPVEELARLGRKALRMP